MKYEVKKRWQVEYEITTTALLLYEVALRQDFIYY